MPEPAEPSRCLLLTPMDAVLPGRLIGELQRRGLSVESVLDPAEAMFELTRRRFVAMIVVEPEQHSRLGELIEAMAAYCPRVLRWRYVGDITRGSARLAPLESNPVNGVDSSDQPTASGAGEGQVDSPSDSAGLPLSWADVTTPTGGNGSASSAGGHHPLVTEEELTLLLGRDDGDRQ